MPKVSSRTRAQLIRVIEDWIKKGQCSGKRMAYQVILGEDGEEVEEVLVNGVVYGKALGIHTDGKKSEEGEVMVQITHLPTGWGISSIPIPRSQALKTIFGLLSIADWSNPSPEFYKKGGSMKNRREVGLMISYCRGGSMVIGHLERLVSCIESLLPKGAGGSPKKIEKRRAGRYISECPSTVEVGDEACSVEI